MLFATALLTALLYWANGAVDWTGLAGHPWQRIGWLAASLVGAAALYFAALLATGWNARSFMRHG